LILHIVWNLVYFITILTFIIGAAMGIAGVLIIDGIPAVNYVLGPIYLKSGKLIPDLTVAGYIDTCVNADGDLAKTLGLNTGSLGAVTDLYDASSQLSNTEKLIKDNASSVAIKLIQARYQELINDVAQTTDPTLGNNHIANILTEMRKWTNYESENTWQKSCSSNTKDYWVQLATQCPEGYAPLTAGASNTGSKNCLDFFGWSSAQTSSRYGAVPAGCVPGSNDFTSTSAAINAYYTNLSTYISDNTALINAVNTDMIAIDDKFKELSGYVLNTISGINNVLKPLVDLFEEATGPSGFSALINCSKNIFLTF
jgi:hypothetical protein